MGLNVMFKKKKKTPITRGILVFVCALTHSVFVFFSDCGRQGCVLEVVVLIEVIF